VVEDDSERCSAKASCVVEPGGTFDLRTATVVGLSDRQLRPSRAARRSSVDVPEGEAWEGPTASVAVAFQHGSRHL
jgi:hypothetical protein